MQHKYTILSAIIALTFAGNVYAQPYKNINVTAPSSYLVRINQTDEAQKKAQAAVQNFTDQAISFLSNPDFSQKAKTKKFTALLTKHFDLNTVSRFTLGKHWRVASKEEKAEYQKLFKKLIIETYSDRFSEYKGQKIKVTGAYAKGKRDIFVTSLITQENGPDINVEWRVRNKKGHYNIIDIIVEGVSMALTQRSDFSSVIQRGGGEVSVLIEHLASR